MEKDRFQIAMKKYNGFLEIVHKNHRINFFFCCGQLSIKPSHKLKLLSPVL